MADNFQKPRLLFGYRHIGIIQYDRVVSFPKGTFFARRIKVIAFLYILQDFLVGRRFALRLQFIQAAARPNLGGSRDKELQFGMRKNRCPDVAPVHHDALRPSHLLLLRHHRAADKRQGGDEAHLVRDLHAANLALHVRAVQVRVRPAGLLVQLKGDADVGQRAPQRLSVHLVAGKEAVLQGVKRYGAVHGARVDINIPYLFCQIFCHRAFPAR